MVNRKALVGIAIAALTAIAETARAADCDTLEDCIKSADAQVAIVASVTSGSDCGASPSGCIRVTASGQHSTLGLPQNAILQLHDRLGEMRPILEASNGVLPKIQIARAPKLNGATGTTIALQFFATPTRRSTEVVGLFSLVNGDQPESGTELAIGRDDRSFYLGSWSSYSDRWFWVPLWDPKVPVSGWFTLFVTFQEDGKTRVDQFSNADREGKQAVSLVSSLVDFGWPIERVPDGNDEKQFLPAQELWLGADSGLPDGFANVIVFNRPLSANERRAVHTAYLKSIPLDFNGAKEPCNTGSYLNNRKYAASLVPTVCGTPHSKLYEVEMTGDFWPHYYKNSASRVFYITPASPSYFQYLEERSLFKSEQMVTFEPIGGNFFYIHHRGLFQDSVWTLNGDDIALSTVKNTPMDPKQIWYVIPHFEGREPYSLLSPVNGGFASAPFEWLARVKATPRDIDFGWRTGWDAPSPTSRRRIERGRPSDPAWANVPHPEPFPPLKLLGQPDPEIDNDR